MAVRRRIAWLFEARRDLANQLDYVAERNPGAALRLDSVVHASVRKLIRLPEIGRRGRVAGTRELVVPRTPYIVIYRVGGDVVSILRVLHGAQDWPPRRDAKD
jgi:addiction module RelE/StbE family toxin